jgi:hypothetical protein
LLSAVRLANHEERIKVLEMGEAAIDLHSFGDVAAILTFLGALTAYLRYVLMLWNKKRILVKYLKCVRVKAKAKNEKLPSGENLIQGSHGFIHITATKHLTSDEIIQACFRSKRLRLLESGGPASHISDRLLVVYVDDHLPLIKGGSKKP